MNTTKRTVYHINPLRLWLVPGMFLIIAAFMLALPSISTAPPATRNVPIYLGIFFLAFAAVMYLIMRRTRLELSQEGVRLDQFGYRLETAWENVAYLDDAPEAEALVLHRPMDCSGAFNLSAARNVEISGNRFFSDEQIGLIAERRLIPIKAFSYHLKSGQLRDDLVSRSTALRSR